MILEAEAEKEAAVQKAKGEAEAIMEVQKATSMGIKMLKEAGADESVIRLRSLEALEKVADGKATKLIIPADLQNMAGVVSAAAEMLKK